MDSHANECARYLGYALQAARAGDYATAGTHWSNALQLASKARGEVHTRAQTLCTAFAHAMVLVTA